MNGPHVLLVLYLVLTILGALLLLALKCRARDFRPFKSWTVTTPTRNLIRVLPAASFISASILILLLARNYNNGQTGFSPEEFQVSLDVGGVGVLLGLFLPCGFLLMILISGHF